MSSLETIVAEKLPKVLIVSRLVWDDSSNSNTLGNLFKNYDPDRIARIYIETKQPNTRCCHRFFQISEFGLVKRLFRPGYVAGRAIDTAGQPATDAPAPVSDTGRREASAFSFVRKHRLWVFSLLRDILWSFNGWKSKELEQFVSDFDPDVVWLDGSPLILMNRLNNHVMKLAGKPAVTFLMDDVYDYRSCASLWDRIYKRFLRPHVRRTVRACNHVFVASPKMKTEYDRTFGVDSTFITKSLDSTSFNEGTEQIHHPLRLVYFGNVLIGRIDTLCMIAQAIKQINADGEKIRLDIYTADPIDRRHRRLLDVGGVTVHPPVPYTEVPGIIARSDVQVFVESLKGCKKNIARLSFSTKIIDYLVSGKCIFAAGPADVAPMEYFATEDAAVVATSAPEIMEGLKSLLNPGTVEEYAAKAAACARRNHSRERMDRTIFSTLKEVASEMPKKRQ